MKVTKFLTSVLFVAALAVGFTSCEEKDKDVNDPFKPSDDPTNPPTEQKETVAIPTITMPEGATVLTVSEARAICAELSHEETTTEKYYVKGWIKKLATKHEAGVNDYGNALFYMAENQYTDGTYDEDDFEAYQVYGKDGKKLHSLDQVLVGDYVIVYGQLTNYNGTYETVGKGAAYIYSSSNPKLEEELTFNYIGDGTETNPYTVQDLLNMNKAGLVPAKEAGEEAYWVEAFIVGSYNYSNADKWVYSSDLAETPNVTLADDASSKDSELLATVKLGDFKNQLNIKDNAANIGKKLKIHGIIETYCGKPGVVNLDKVYLDGTEITLPGSDDVEIDESKIYTPSEANALAEELRADKTSSKKITVEGFVSKIDKAYDAEKGITFYMSDNEDSAETFYCNGVSGGSDIVVGKKIKIVGNLTNYKGNTPQLAKGGTYTLIEEGETGGEITE